MHLSIIIPAFNAAGHISKALASVASEIDRNGPDQVEVLVVDDGSNDTEALKQIVAASSINIQLLHHRKNLGMCAARNTGISATQGKFVTLLDADDEFVPGWHETFDRIVDEWPAAAQVCYTPCINSQGTLTCSKPGYRGWLTAEDMVRETFSGEYNPIFRGTYIRQFGYDDIGTRKSCGILSYLRMVRENPFWITDKVMRRYNDSVAQSVTTGWTRPDKASETSICFSRVLNEHGGFISSVAPERYERLRLKLLLYKMLALRGRDFAECWRARSLTFSWAGTFALLVLGPWLSSRLLGLAKRLGVLRRYG